MAMADCFYVTLGWEISWELQFMLMEMRQILNWRNQDISKEILLDLVRKDVAEFNDKFYHF